jgi:hypothetical protein
MNQFVTGTPTGVIWERPVCSCRCKVATANRREGDYDLYKSFARSDAAH